MLAPKDALPVTEQVDVAVTMFDSTDRVMENSSRVHMNYGSGEVIARIILFGIDELNPGEKAYGQLRMEEPIPLRTGDPFVLRFFSPVISIAGGGSWRSGPSATSGVIPRWWRCSSKRRGGRYHPGGSRPS